MPHLAQQELLPPAPRERLIVPHGCVAHWGVDGSTKRVAIATHNVDTGARSVHMASFPAIDGAARLAAIYDNTHQLARTLARTGLPGIVLVEQPSGAKVNHELEFAVGVIQAAILDGVIAATRHVPKIRCIGISPGWWKKRACGSGNLPKPTKKTLGRTPTYLDYPVARWARENGYQGDSWDAADAWGICEAARREIALERR